MMMASGMTDVVRARLAGRGFGLDGPGSLLEFSDSVDAWDGAMEILSLFSCMSR
jgi:hypothetical protein